MSFLVASLFYLYMGHLLRISLGLFHPKIALYTLLYFALVPLLVRRSFWPSLRNSYSFRQGLYLLLGVGQLIFIHTIVKNPHVIYPVNFNVQNFFHELLRVAEGLSGLLVLVLGLSILAPEDRIKGKLGFLYRSLASSIIALLLFAQLLVPALSPHPLIDVYVNNTAAVDFFLAFKNPYHQAYVDIYKGLFSYIPGFLYFPGLLFLLAPFKALLGDIRYCFIFFQVLNVILIFRIAKRRVAESFLPWLLPILWLSFPVTYHVLEQAWTDTLLIAFTFLIVDSLDRRKWGWVGILAGLVFATKQYAFVISFFAVLRVAQVAGWSQAVRCAVVATGAFSAVLAPFILADFKGFYAMTIQAQTGPGIRTDSLGMAALLVLKRGYHLPGFAQIVIALLGIAGGAWMIWTDPLKKMDRIALALFFSYGCSFLFGKWAFCNYHYLLASFLILYLATELEVLTVDSRPVNG